MNFDRAVFFNDWPSRIPELKLTPERQARVHEVIGLMERDTALTRLRDAAYMMATIRWETAQTFRPLKEIRGRVGSHLRELQDRYWGSGFYGRGYVQLTWEKNYRHASQKLAGRSYVSPQYGTVTLTPLTLVEHPDYLLIPALSYDVISMGMREGWFTGKRLDLYIREGTAPDYRNARRVVNGLDQADRIARYANNFELLLRASRR